MVKAKKFGAFAGVFTPSLLTILGVIMYMRLGWVVGQAGLIYTIIIILFAHVISLSTGLSVSSIATDKKIKAGGIYYMLSRSLGLPMGGAIGITLFIGTAFSIALYLVGFAENFLSIEPIREFLGLQQDVNGYRIIGSVAILLLVGIAFISTSLAIKTQYYILGFIALSLLSIFAGFFINTGLHPETVNIDPITSKIDLAVIFAVFFPAVTGFTAGVAMSGDLKDPKKSIPFGTMASIAVGFFVYVGLAIAIAFFVNRDLLINDINFLMTVAWFAPLVVAGIWGATLSSALGGILGGPRILQAMSSDKIGPGFFSKVYGINNEPRIALLVIFLIAEAGILIGELNMIAEVVSMFYLASYGFINLAYYLESWASTDFRPTFKINRYIGLIGFLAAFGVMFELNAPAMFAALILMVGIYFILKRKQLKLDYGDVWQSVWSSLMRTALEKMDNAEEVERNWQPNIILFSGGTQKRPHLLDLGKCLVGRHGVLSNFDLIENKKAKVLFPKKNQSQPGEVSAGGVFTRRQTVQDIYHGIDMITRTYGFSGLEPNTVMLGWARQTRNPVRFVELLKTMYDLDLNVLMLGYDKQVGFGKHEKIDIWFKDKSSHGNLALTLSKLLVLSEAWQNAQVRVMIVNYQNEKSDSIYKKISDILEHMRIDADIKVINNQIERKPFYDIVKDESIATDLVFLEIPKIKENEEAEFVKNTNNLLEEIGTVMLIKASSSFKKLKIGIEEQEQSDTAEELDKILEKTKLPEIILPEKGELAEEITAISESSSQLINEYYIRKYFPLLNYRTDKLSLIRQAVEKTYGVLEERIPKLKNTERIQLVSQLKTSVLIRLGKIIDEQRKRVVSETEETLETGTSFFLENLLKITGQIPDRVNIRLNEDDLNPTENEPFRARSFKRNTLHFRKRKLQTEGIPYVLQLNNLCRQKILINNLELSESTFTRFGEYNIRFVFEYQKLLHSISDALLVIEKNITDKNINTIIEEGKENVFAHLNRLSGINKEFEENLPANMYDGSYRIINEISELTSKVPANVYIRSYPKKKIRENIRRIKLLPAKWANNQTILLSSLHTEAQLLLIEYRLYKVIVDAINENGRILDEQILSPVNEISKSFGGNNKQEDGQQTFVSLNSNQLQLNLNKVIDKAFRNIKSVLRQLPESVEIFTEETTNELTNNQFSGTEIIRFPLFRLVDYFVQNGLIAPLIKSTNQLVEDIHQAATKIEDAARLYNLNFQEKDNHLADISHEQTSDIETFLEEQKNRITENTKVISETFASYKQNIINQLGQTSSELHLYRLTKAAETSSGLPRKESEKHALFFRDRMKKLNAFIQKQMANLWHSQSEARLLAKKITDDDSSKLTVINQVLNFRDSVSTRQGNIEKLPFYYQQLFLSKYNYQAEYWHGRQKELADARKAVNRYKSGHNGALIVTGEGNSGKSFFANYVGHLHFQNEAIYTINPTGSGSTKMKDLLLAINEATERRGTLHEIMENIPDGTVMVFDDMELWWEKTNEGTKLIESIFNLVKLYNEKVFFIFVFNQAAYGIIKHLLPFEDYSLLTLNLQPFRSKDLQEIISFRHRTSGFNLQIDGIPGRISQAKQARLFNQVFRFSGGNVGTALLCWIASIKDFKKGTIVIQSPRTPETGVLDLLAREMKIYLVQFILHKRLTVDKLCRILMENDSKVKYVLQYLKRAGLITEKAGAIFEMDSNIRYHLSKYLFDSFDSSDRNLV